jgi:hypothetical protein
MRACVPNRTLSRFAAVIVVLVGLLFAGGHVARADDHEQPVGVYEISNSPGVMTVYWLHSGDGVFQFDVEEKTTNTGTTVACPCGFGPEQISIRNLQPGTPYQFRVCAVYDDRDTDRTCSDYTDPVKTMAAQPPATNLPASKPVITGIDAGFDRSGNASMGVHFETAGDSYDSYTVRQRVKAAPGAPDNLFQDEDSKASGSSGFHVVDGLLPGTTYQFQVRGCYKDFFFITDCQDWGPLYDATTLQLANASTRPTPAVTSGGSSDTWIAIGWSVMPRYTYDHYVIQYKPATGGAPGASMTGQVQGNQVNYTAENLTPGTAYSFTVQGCDLILMPTPGVDCAAVSAPYTASTTTPPPGPIAVVPPQLSLSLPTVTAGNTVKVTGQAFANSGETVTLTLSGAGSPVTLGTATVSQGGFSTTVTIPASTTAGNYTIHAQAISAKADVGIQVSAPGGKRTLTVTDSAGAVATSIATDTPYTLTGNNFAYGFGVTVYLDHYDVTDPSKTGPQLGTATAGLQDATFTMTIDVSANQIGNKNGDHTLLVVSNGFVLAQVTLPFEVSEVVH